MINDNDIINLLKTVKLSEEEIIKINKVYPDLNKIKNIIKKSNKIRKLAMLSFIKEIIKS